MTVTVIEYIYNFQSDQTQWELNVWSQTIAWIDNCKSNDVFEIKSVRLENDHDIMYMYKLASAITSASFCHYLKVPNDYDI